MQKYTNNDPEFSDSVDLLETTDTNHADNFNVATMTLFNNTLSLKEGIDSISPQPFSVAIPYKKGNYVTKGNSVYRALEDIPAGQWDAEKWIEASLYDDMTSGDTYNGYDEINEVTDDENSDFIINTPDGPAKISAENLKLFMVGAMPTYYKRANLFTPNKTSITIHANTQVNINGKGYCNRRDVVLDTSSVKQAGKDVYIYACAPINGSEPVFVVSRNSTVPSGYTAENSRKIGGFHCLCADVGSISGHPLSGYVAGDILPASVWDLDHRPVSEPEGMVYVSGLGKWYDIYLASWDGSKLVSVFGGSIADGASARKYHGYRFIEDFGKIGKKLPQFYEFNVFAKGSNERTNIKNSADPGTTGGHIDTANRRMISNDGLEDCCGVLWQWMMDFMEYTPGTTYTAGNRYLSGYAWHDEPSYEPAVDSEQYGAVDGLLRLLLAGGAWLEAGHCGSRSAICDRFGAYVISSLGGRGASEPRKNA